MALSNAERQALADVVPHHVVEAGGRRIELLALPHRIADAAIRASDLGPHIRACFEAIESGDAVPMARIAPTSLVFGAWDSRDTRIRLPRAVRADIRAHDISVLTRSGVYSGAFGQAALGLGEREWSKGAEVGFAPAPSVDRPGGVLVHGAIVHSASVVLNVLRRYRIAEGCDVSPAYLLGLALGAVLSTGREHHLRSECPLVPATPACGTRCRRAVRGRRSPSTRRLSRGSFATRHACGPRPPGSRSGAPEWWRAWRAPRRSTWTMPSPVNALLSFRTNLTAPRIHLIPT